jgi:hypothetical protein
MAKSKARRTTDSKTEDSNTIIVPKTELGLERIWFWWYVYYRAHLVRPGTDPRVGRYGFYRFEYQ